MDRRLTAFVTSVCVVALSGCATTAVSRHEQAGAKAQIFDQMGGYERPVTISTPEAQLYFNQGLTWMYAFNHDEAIKSFAHAAGLDPDCAMAWWGVALCEGPNYNDPVMTPDRPAAAWSALLQARARTDNTNLVDRALLPPLSFRHAVDSSAHRPAPHPALAAARRCVRVGGRNGRRSADGAARARG